MAEWMLDHGHPDSVRGVGPAWFQVTSSRPIAFDSDEPVGASVGAGEMWWNALWLAPMSHVDERIAYGG